MSSLWGGRFTGETDRHFATFNASWRFDKRLIFADIKGCIAQVHALERADVLTSQEVTSIVEGLQQILHSAGNPEYLNKIDYAKTEDVHSFIEARLVELIGLVGYKLHTGRSRNDQVATATRIFLRDEITAMDSVIADTQQALIELATKYANDPIPAYTHLQKAQPVLFAHFLLAYYEMLKRDRQRLKDLSVRVNVLPLGSGAVAGTSFNIDREKIAEELGFAEVTRNSIDAVSDRDYIMEFVNFASITMVHLSRLAEDLIIYSTQEFGFIKLGDAISTGSSLMPQKKNPDSLELIRGKSARIFGHMTSILTLAKGLPLAYNKDLQEDKEILFDTIDTLSDSLRVTATVLRNIELNQERARAAAITDYTNATDLADYLVRKGLEFRKAHDVIGRIVLYAIEHNKQLTEISLDEYKKFSAMFDEDLFVTISLEKSLESKSQIGGTASQRVREELLTKKEI